MNLDPHQSREAIRCAGSFPREGWWVSGTGGGKEEQNQLEEVAVEVVILVCLSEIDAVD